MRRNESPTSESDKWVPSESLVISFEGQSLPNQILIFKVKSKVKPFINKPAQCFSCFKFGHTLKSYRGKKRCIMCGEELYTEACASNTPSCANCQVIHKSINPQCPVYQQYSHINKIMAHDNFPFIDARRLVMKPLEGPYRTMEDFPELQTQPKNKKLA